MFKLHEDIADWYYWYSPRLRKWCALRRYMYSGGGLKGNENLAMKYISKSALRKRILQTW